MDLREEIKTFFKGDISDDDETLKEYSRDASLFEVRPRLVVFPKDVEDIKNLVLFVEKNKDKKLYLTPRSGGTDMTGGPLGESIVVEFSKYFNHIKEIGPDYAVAEPGVYYRDFEKETLKHDLLLPSYPASREICMVGGMVSNNSGGEKTLSYGKTEMYIKQLKMVLRDGEEHAFIPLNKEQLNEKIKIPGLEGEIYKKIYEIISGNYDILQNAKPKVSKNSAGYYLWNVWDKQIFDLNKLLVGSQGTLGIVTEVKFRLIKPKIHSRLLVIFLEDIEPLTSIINKILSHKPESLESYDDNTLKLAIRFLPEIMKLMKGSVLSLGLKFLPELWMALAGGFPKLVLIAEFTGDSEEEVVTKAKAAMADTKEFSVKSRITKSAEDAQKYWTIRRESFNLLRHHIKDKRTAPFIDDFIVRPEKLPEFLPKLDEILGMYKKDLVYTIAGHPGDGNFHIIPLMNLSDPRSRQIIPELSEKVYKLVLSFGGSITAEHNDGLIRSPYLKEMYGEEIYNLFVEVKNIFDPDNIFNPGKKVGATLQYAIEHISTK